MKEHNSGADTILLVLVLIIIVGAIVWFVQSQDTQNNTEDDNARIEVQLPSSGSEEPASTEGRQ